MTKSLMISFVKEFFDWKKRVFSNPKTILTGPLRALGGKSV
jgi:hypothetical protein